MSLTDTGAAEYLKMLLMGVDTTQIAGGGNMYLGLCNNVPAESLTLADLVEPAIGTNGYARIAVTRNAAGFPNSGVVNGAPYLETADKIWTATGDYTESVTRLFLTPEATAVVGEVWALGEGLSATRLIGSASSLGDRTFRFRQYMR